MFSWWLFGAIFMVVMTFVVHKFIDDCGFVLSVSLIVYLIVSACMYFPIDKDLIREEVSIDKQYIMSLKDSQYSKEESSVSGTLLFFYGSRKTKEGFSYHTLIGNDMDGYLIKSLDGEKTHLFLDGGNSPYVNYVYVDREYKWETNWFIGGIIKPFKNDIEKDILIKTELHLPADAVQVDYTVDLK